MKYVTWWVFQLVFLAVVCTPETFAQNRVLQVVLTEDPGPLFDVTRRSMAVELERAGLRVESQTLSPVEQVGSDQLAAMAASVQAQYIAELRFDRVGDRANFAMTLYDGETGESLSRLDRENVPVELEYDTVVARSARALLAEAGVHFDRPQPAVASLPSSPEEARDPGFQQTPVLPEGPVVREEAAPPGENGFAFGVAIAPALVTGDASDYLKFGYVAAVSGDYRVRGPRSTLGFGLMAGAGRLYPEGAASTIDLYVLPFGPSLRIESSSSAALRVGVRGSGGAALLSVRGGVQGDLAKLVPYALGGLEVSYQLAGTFLLRLESNYTVFFEDVYPVMAFTPSLAIEWQP